MLYNSPAIAVWTSNIYKSCAILYSSILSIVNVKVRDNVVMDNVYIKRDPSYTTELHIDKDDAKNFELNNGDVVILE